MDIKIEDPFADKKKPNGVDYLSPTNRSRVENVSTTEIKVREDLPETLEQAESELRHMFEDAGMDKNISYDWIKLNEFRDKVLANIPQVIVGQKAEIHNYPTLRGSGEVIVDTPKKYMAELKNSVAPSVRYIYDVRNLLPFGYQSDANSRGGKELDSADLWGDIYNNGFLRFSEVLEKTFPGIKAPLGTYNVFRTPGPEEGKWFRAVLECPYMPSAKQDDLVKSMPNVYAKTDENV